MNYRGYTIITRIGKHEEYYLWTNNRTGKETARLGFFYSVAQAKKSVDLHIDFGRWFTSSDLEIRA